MDFENLKDTWEAFGEQNPMWAVLTDGKPNDYQWDEDQFFDKGVQAIRRVFDQFLYAWMIPNSQDGRVLDFGCGVGRLSLALANEFKSVHGVDISSAMVEQARAFAIKRQCLNCQFHLNQKQDLSLFESGSFDMIVSMIVLQHMEPIYSTVYIKEFLRLLKPGGFVVFQLPEEVAHQASYQQYSDEKQPEMEMYGKSRNEVIDLIESHGAQVKMYLQDNSCGPEIRSFRYFAQKL